MSVKNKWDEKYLGRHFENTFLEMDKKRSAEMAENVGDRIRVRWDRSFRQAHRQRTRDRLTIWGFVRRLGHANDSRDSLRGLTWVTIGLYSLAVVLAVDLIVPASSITAEAVASGGLQLRLLAFSSLSRPKSYLLASCLLPKTISLSVFSLLGLCGPSRFNEKSVRIGSPELWTPHFLPTIPATLISLPRRLPLANMLDLEESDDFCRYAECLADGKKSEFSRRKARANALDALPNFESLSCRLWTGFNWCCFWWCCCSCFRRASCSCLLSVLSLDEEERSSLDPDLLAWPAASCWCSCFILSNFSLKPWKKRVKSHSFRRSCSSISERRLPLAVARSSDIWLSF